MAMPKLWRHTVKAHREDVRDAIMRATLALVAEKGPASVTMSDVAVAAGIGRATLYKYFSGIGPILHAWHEGQVERHLAELEAVRRAPGPGRLEAVLAAYAAIAQRSGRHDPDVSALLHRDPQLASARSRLHALVRELVAAAADAGEVRADVGPDELAAYCIRALGATADTTDEDAVKRIVAVVMAGLQPPKAM